MKKLRLTSSKKKPLTAGIALLAVLLLSASCTQEDLPGGNNDDGPAPLALTTLKATDIDVKEIATRAATTKDYPTADSIGFFVKADAANGYTACNNRKGKYSTARSRWLPVDTIWLNSHNADIAIYAPYDASHTTPATLNLTAALRPADGSKDIWCKHTTANNTSKNLAVTLEHVYTRFYLTVTRDANYKADASLTALALKGENVYESATYKPFETTPYTYSTTTGLTPTVAEQALNASTASATYDLLLIPAELTGDLTLTLTVDGKKMETAIDKTRFTGSKLEAGKQYNVDLTLKPGKLEIASVSLVKWDALPEINGGQAEFEQSLGIDIGLDFVIAPGNLRAVKPAGSSTYEYFFAEEQGYYSGVNNAEYDPAGGDYFCWNTLDPSVFDVTQTEWKDERDPCRQIEGGQWQTPTLDQIKKFAELKTAGKAVWGTYTMKDGTTPKYGWYFGTAPGITDVPKADQDKYVFLPAAGYRVLDTTGTINDEGSTGFGYYWSSTPSASIANNAYVLGFNSSTVYDGTGTSRRYFGHSVRCVKNKPKPAHAIEVKGLNFYVADGNVIATKQAAGGYTYKFADEQGYNSGSKNSYNTYDPADGDYFCWNTTDPADNQYNTTGVWDNDRDVCRKIGDGKWYTPTLDQWNLLINNGYTWGIYKMKDRTEKGGVYFGTTSKASAESQQDSFPFVPGNGFIEEVESGKFGLGRDFGYYWSSTFATTMGIAMTFYYNMEISADTREYPDYKGKMSVRCIRDK